MDLFVGVDNANYSKYLCSRKPLKASSSFHRTILRVLSSISGITRNKEALPFYLSYGIRSANDRRRNFLLRNGGICNGKAKG